MLCIDIPTYGQDLQQIVTIFENIVGDKDFTAELIDKASNVIAGCVLDGKVVSRDNLKQTLMVYLGLKGDRHLFRELAYLIVGNKFEFRLHPVLSCRSLTSCVDFSAIIEFQKYEPTKSLMQVLVLSGPHAGEVLWVKMTRDRALYLASRLGLCTRKNRHMFRGINSLIDRLAVAEIVRSNDVCRVISLDGSKALRKYNA